MSLAPLDPPPFPVLRTPHLLLREIEPADTPALYEIHSDAEAMQWFGNDPIATLTQAAALVDTFAGWRRQANPGTRWGLQKTGCATLIGSVGLFGWHRAWRKCSVGYELARSAQGQGYMREALRAVLGWGFEQMALNRIEALIHPSNAPSRRLVKHFGFVEEGRLRQVGFWNGQFHDMLHCALLRDDWTAST